MTWVHTLALLLSNCVILKRLPHLSSPLYKMVRMVAPIRKIKWENASKYWFICLAHFFFFFKSSVDIATANLIFSFVTTLWFAHDHLAFPGGSNGKESAYIVGDSGWIPGLGRPTEGRVHDHPLQYSCLENPMDRGAWQSQRVGHN